MKKFLQNKKTETYVSYFFIIYVMIGLLFAFFFAWYYKWEFYGYLSPNFFSVVFTWPFQIIGLISDISFYGIEGKPI